MPATNMTEQDYPFIYISSLNRTGSTVLAEALTLIPFAFIFREPHLGKNYFALQDRDVEMLRQYDIDLYEFTLYRLPFAFVNRRLRWLGYRQDYIVREFKQKLLPELQQHIKQIGVKEIKHMGWQNYAQHFPNMRVVMTGRDPRDIYLSMYYKWKNGTLHWHKPFTPHTVAEELNIEFKHQMAQHKNTDCICITYEELCLDPSVIDKIREFVCSPIPRVGEIGAFVATHPKRVDEFQIHGSSITTQRVKRWQTETNKHLVEEAHQVWNLMSDYCVFWGYEAQSLDGIRRLR